MGTLLFAKAKRKQKLYKRIFDLIFFRDSSPTAQNDKFNDFAESSVDSALATIRRICERSEATIEVMAVEVLYL